VCEQAPAAFCWPLRYEVEPIRGIARARNRAVRCALDRAEFVAFLDDDEVPEPLWLDELLSVQRIHDADVVTGPALRCISGGAPRWLKDVKFLQARSFPTGHRLTFAYTNNVLVRAQVFRSMESLFPEHLGLSGGEDVHFFQRVHAAGYTIVWADRAVVREWVPANRLTAKGVFLRACSTANAQGMLDLETGRAPAIRVELLRQTIYCVGKAFLLFPLGLMAGTIDLAGSIWHFGCAAGMVLAILGCRFAYYRTTHGL
jgi:hypothetical protein